MTHKLLYITVFVISVLLAILQLLYIYADLTTTSLSGSQQLVSLALDALCFWFFAHWTVKAYRALNQSA
jgi:hypothetical protein